MGEKRGESKEVVEQALRALRSNPRWPQGLYRLAREVENPCPGVGDAWFEAQRFKAGEVYRIVHRGGLRLAPRGMNDFIDVGRQPLLLRALLDQLCPITSLVELSVELDRLGVSVVDVLCALVSRGWAGAALGALLGEARVRKRDRRLQGRYMPSSLEAKVFTESIHQKLQHLEDVGAHPLSAQVTRAARPPPM